MGRFIKELIVAGVLATLYVQGCAVLIRAMQENDINNRTEEMLSVPVCRDVFGRRVKCDG